MGLRSVFLLLWMLAAMPPAAAAQIPVPVQTAAPSTAGRLQVAPVRFEGRTLFTIAAPKDVTERAAIIEDNLRHITASSNGNILGIGPMRFDSATFRVAIGVENGYPTLYATDAKAREAAPIMTLTEADAAYQGIPDRQLAQQWRDLLQSVLGSAVKAAEPDYFRTRLLWLPWLLAGVIGFSLLAGWLRTALARREAAIADLAHRVDPSDTADSSEARRLRVGRALVHSLSWILIFVLVAAWAVILLWTLYIIPSTRAFASTLWVRMVSLVGIWLLFIILDNTLNFVIVRLSDNWVLHTRPHSEEHSRAALRRPTIVGAITNLKTVLLLILALAATLTAFQVSGASALTVSALFGFALSFAAQSIIKDYVTGFLIIAEDQFAIGDYVSINGVSGVVEDLTMRIVQIRADDGGLVTIANGTITQALNATSSWSRVDFRITIAPSSDVDKAAAILLSAMNEVTNRPRWAAAIMEPPQMLGVESVTANGITLRAWVKATPTDRPFVAREMNKTVVDAFRSNGITIASLSTALAPAQNPAIPAPR